MLNTVEFIFFVILSIYALKEAVIYGIYELKNNNKFGGIFIIIFSTLTVILTFFSLINA